MAKVKNMSGQHLDVPALGRLVLQGQVVEVPDELVFGLTQQDIWRPEDKAAQAAHAAGEKARDERRAVQDRVRHGLPASDPVEVVDGDTESE